MSGICGMCEPGRELRADIIVSMLSSFRLKTSSAESVLGSKSIVVGCAGLTGQQSVACVDSVLVAADADLVQLSQAAGALSISESEAHAMPKAELIARLYRLLGLSALDVLHGAFSVAIWDTAQQRLLLAIDRFGVKSLYWRREDQRLLFGSRLSAIRAEQAVPPQVNPSAIMQFLLFSAIPAPLSSDLGTKKLQPGRALVFSDGRTQELQYWDLTFPESNDTRTARWAGELRDEIRAAVRRHVVDLRTDCTGCFLSGGTDSSSIVAFATELCGQTQSFSIVFDDDKFSELDYVNIAAAKFRTRHFQKFLVAQDVSDAVDKMIEAFDEPFANSSAIGSYYCALNAREQGVTTLLAGDGGDELFAGNERYASDKRFALYQRVPQWLRRTVIDPAVFLLPKGDSKWSLPRRYVLRANIPNPRRILSYGLFLGLPPEEIFETAFLEEIGTENWLAIPEEHFRRAQATSELNRLLYLDVKMTLADNDLRKVCGTAKLAGVNVRFPFLDDSLAELSGRIPAGLKLKGFEKRYIFKEAMRGALPDRILYKKKHGFGVPVAKWLLTDVRMQNLMNDLLHDPGTRQRGYFLPGFVERLASLHRKQPDYYGEILWYLLALELWHRRYMDKSRDVVQAL